MNKKTNTILFIIGGTFFNILVTVICFLILLVTYSRFYTLLPEASIPWALPVIFISSIVISFLIYRTVIKFMMKKINMEKYFDPIFKRRPPHKR